MFRVPSDISFSGYLFLSGVVLVASPNAHYRLSSANTSLESNRNKIVKEQTLLDESPFSRFVREASDEFLLGGTPKETNAG